MSATGFTPIIVYNSGTASNVPLAANLAAGELAINYADGKLYYKDSGGTVQVIASKAAAAGVLSFSAGTTGLTPSTATSGAVTLAGTLATTNGGTGLTVFTSGGAVYSTSTSALTTGTLPVTAGGTGLTSLTAGYIPYGNGTGALSSSANLTFNGTGTLTTQSSAATAAIYSLVSPSYDTFSLTMSSTGFTYSTTNTSSQRWTINGTEYLRITSSGGIAFGGSTNYGSSGQVLQSNGNASPTWVTFSGGATVTPTTSNTTYYITGTTLTSGTFSTAYISNTNNVNFNASTGTLNAPVVNASQGFHTNANTNTVSYTVPASTNAMTAGPFTVATSTTVTVSTGSRWVIV